MIAIFNPLITISLPRYLYYRIVAEVHEIRDTVRTLKDKLRSSEMAMARLMKTKSQLQTDISVKENSLSVDSKSCMGMRKTFPKDGEY